MRTAESFYVEAVTLGEFGEVTTSTVPGEYPSSGEAFAAAVDYGTELAGPERDGYRRPSVTVFRDETHGMAVRVGDAEVDPSYTLVYVWSIASATPRPPVGRGYTVCKV